MASVDETWRTRIVCDPQVHHGAPVIRGTRVCVSTIVATLAELTIEQLLAEYPQLTAQDVRAALLYASESAHRTLVA